MRSIDVSQKMDVLKYLTDDKTKNLGITSKEAEKMFGTTRLSAIIHELRRKDGVRIVSINETILNRYGHPCTFSRYYFKEDLKNE